MRPSSLKKRQRYLEVATELFLEQGYESTGLDQIIERCGGSKLTLYNYFGDKQGLLKAVVRGLTESLETLVQFESTNEDTLENQLQTFAFNYLKLVNSPDMLRLTRLIMSQQQHHPELVEYFLDCTASYSQKSLTLFFEQQKQAGRLSIDDVDMASDQFLGALKGNRFIIGLLSNKNHMSEDAMKSYAEYTVKGFLMMTEKR